MVRLSEKTKLLLKEDILGVLNDNPLKCRFTKEIGYELRRDKEFVLGLLLEMKNEGWIEEVNSKGAKGIRKKWRISKNLFEMWNKKN